MVAKPSCPYSGAVLWLSELCSAVCLHCQPCMNPPQSSLMTACVLLQ